jgi:hypothetical protein
MFKHLSPPDANVAAQKTIGKGVGEAFSLHVGGNAWICGLRDG